MAKKGTLTKSLAVIGTGLVWIPILAPILFTAILVGTRGEFRFDWLMPAELFPLALAGSAILTLAAYRAQHHQKLMIWSTCIFMAMLLSGQAIAVATGLVSGEMQPSGFWWVVVILPLLGYDAAVFTVGIGGVLLLRDLFHPYSALQTR